MRIGSSLALIVIGAILAFAVSDLIPNVDLTMAGYILMGAGLVGLIVSIVMSRPKSLNHVSESRTINDPNTGERITRNEVRDNGGI